MSILSPDNPLFLVDSHLRSLGWTSDAFSVCVYRAVTTAWNSAIELTAGDKASGVRKVQITSADGRTSMSVERDSFLAVPHSEPRLTVSADWFTGEEMDGYVTSTFVHEGNISSERYVFGTLDETQFLFVDALLQRFAVLKENGSTPLIVVSTSETASDQDWHDYFVKGGELLTDLMVTTTGWRGQRPQRALVLARTTDFEIYARPHHV